MVAARSKSGAPRIAELYQEFSVWQLRTRHAYGVLDPFDIPVEVEVVGVASLMAYRK